MAFHPARALAEAAKPASYDFKVCRIPGMDAAISNQTIYIPAGTEFDENHPSDEDPLYPDVAPTQYMAFVTTGAAILPADGFCVTVPVKSRSKIGADAIRYSLGDMYEPVGNWRGASAIPPVALTYGHWEPASD